MSATAANKFVHAKRLEKAFKLAQFLNRHAITSADVQHATPEEWVTAAKHAGVTWDPTYYHDETIALTVEKLRRLEELQELRATGRLADAG